MTENEQSGPKREMSEPPEKKKSITQSLDYMRSYGIVPTQDAMELDQVSKTPESPSTQDGVPSQTPSSDLSQTLMTPRSWPTMEPPSLPPISNLKSIQEQANIDRGSSRTRLTRWRRNAIGLYVLAKTVEVTYLSMSTEPRIFVSTALMLLPAVLVVSLFLMHPKWTTLCSQDTFATQNTSSPSKVEESEKTNGSSKMEDQTTTG